MARVQRAVEAMAAGSATPSWPGTRGGGGTRTPPVAPATDPGARASGRAAKQPRGNEQRRLSFGERLMAAVWPSETGG